MSWLTALAVALIAVAMWILYAGIIEAHTAIDRQRRALLSLADIAANLEREIEVLRQRQDAVAEEWTALYRKILAVLEKAP